MQMTSFYLNDYRLHTLYAFNLTDIADCRFGQMLVSRNSFFDDKRPLR